MFGGLNNVYFQGIWEGDKKNWKTPKAIKDVKVMEAKTLLINWPSQESPVLFLFFFLVFSLDIHRYLNLGGLVVGTQFLALDFTFISAINPGQLFGFCCSTRKKVIRRSYFCEALLWLGTLSKSGNWILIWCIVYYQTS